MKSSRPEIPVRGERGIALIAALCVLMLTAVLAATFMATSIGESTQSSNVHIARGALLSADAGVRTMQQRLANLARAKLDSACGAWAGNGPVIVAPEHLFPAGNLAPTTATNPRFTATGSISFLDTTITDTSQVYDFTYNVTSSGSFGSLGARGVQSQGILRVSASRGSFADYLLFTHIHTMADGGTIWFSSSGTFDGRVHTNGQFRLAYIPTFYDEVSSVNNSAWYYNKGNPKQLASDHNGSIDTPNFYGGFHRGVDEIPLPANAYNQQNAALGLDPKSGTSASNSTINSILGTANGTSPPPTGTYLVHSGSDVTGGIYVQGSLDQMYSHLDSLGRQVYELRQGGTTRIYTLDRSANTTFVKVGASTTPYVGLPRGIVYVNSGQVSDLRGPDRVSGVPRPAIANGTQLLVAATGDIILKRDLTYNDYNAGGSVLGVYSANGSIRVGSGAPNDMYLDGYVMAIGSSGQFYVDGYDSGSPRGTFHMRGGMVARYYGAFYTFNTNGSLATGYARDFHYDRRGMIPPYYPSTDRFKADTPSARTLVWKEI
jgi:Tfp pilus assembly protein PilX